MKLQEQAERRQKEDSVPAGVTRDCWNAGDFVPHTPIERLPFLFGQDDSILYKDSNIKTKIKIKYEVPEQ